MVLFLFSLYHAPEHLKGGEIRNWCEIFRCLSRDLARLIHSGYDERKSGKRKYGKARGLALDSMRLEEQTAAESRPQIADFDRRDLPSRVALLMALLVRQQGKRKKMKKEEYTDISTKMAWSRDHAILRSVFTRGRARPGWCPVRAVGAEQPRPCSRDRACWKRAGRTAGRRADECGR